MNYPGKKTANDSDGIEFDKLKWALCSQETEGKSDKAFAAAIYVVWYTLDSEEPLEVRLVAGKTRVFTDWNQNTVR